jgi:hypothetical protein
MTTTTASPSGLGPGIPFTRRCSWNGARESTPGRPLAHGVSGGGLGDRRHRADRHPAQLRPRPVQLSGDRGDRDDPAAAGRVDPHPHLGMEPTHRPHNVHPRPAPRPGAAARLAAGVGLAAIGGLAGPVIASAALQVSDAQGRTVSWHIDSSALIGYGLFVLLSSLMGMAFGALVHNTAAVAAYFAIPTLITLVAIPFATIRE